MALSQWLRSIAQHFFDTARQEDRYTLVKLLRDAYLDEVKDVKRFTQHAERMYYHHFRERLQRIVAEEQTHIQWLREKIIALGGDLPTVAGPTKLGKNSWENLRLDLEEEKKDYDELLQGLQPAERFDSAIAEGLRRIRQEEHRHREELLDLLLKSEPGVPPHPTAQRPTLEKQKRAWLEQQKMEWIDKRRATWEAEGKPTPWIEWLTQQEYAWTVNELPNRELAWTLRLAEQEAQ
jgi:bacterioferritin